MLVLEGEAPNAEIMLTQKIFEYLAAGKPILAAAPRGALSDLVRRSGAGVVVEMVHELKKMDLDRMTALNEKLRSIENEADRLMLELYREIYSGSLDSLQMFLLKEFFEILEKAIDRCREAGVVAYEIVLKNS